MLADEQKSSCRIKNETIPRNLIEQIWSNGMT